QVAFAVHLMGDDATVSPPRFFSEPAKVINRERDLGLALSQRLAVFERHRAGDFSRAVFEFVGDGVQKQSARFARQLSPRLERLVRVGYCLSDAIAIHRRDLRDSIASRGVYDLLKRAGNAPVAVKIKRIGFHKISERIILVALSLRLW